LSSTSPRFVGKKRFNDRSKGFRFGQQRVTYEKGDTPKKPVFRYDSTGLRKELEPPAYPHHKHEGREDNGAKRSQAEEQLMTFTLFTIG